MVFRTSLTSAIWDRSQKCDPEVRSQIADSGPEMRSLLQHLALYCAPARASNAKIRCPDSGLRTLNSAAMKALNAIVCEALYSQRSSDTKKVLRLHQRA